jgi:hypothetical protein
MRQLLARREATLRRNLEVAEARLSEVAAAIEVDGLTVTGSRGNLRPHPLLRIEAELKKEVAATLGELLDVTRRLESEAQLSDANALTAWTPEAPEASVG